MIHQSKLIVGHVTIDISLHVKASFVIIITNRMMVCLLCLFDETLQWGFFLSIVVVVLCVFSMFMVMCIMRVGVG